MVVDLTVTIGVNTFKQLLDLLLTQGEIIALEAHTKLIRTNITAIVLIKVGEGRSQVTLLQIVVRLEAGGDELGVVDETVLVRVDNVHCVKKLRLGQVNVIDLLHTLLKLLESERAVTILVHLGEGDAKGLNLVFRDA